LAKNHHYGNISTKLCICAQMNEVFTVVKQILISKLIQSNLY